MVPIPLSALSFLKDKPSGSPILFYLSRESDNPARLPKGEGSVQFLNLTQQGFEESCTSSLRASGLLLKYIRDRYHRASFPDENDGLWIFN